MKVLNGNEVGMVSGGVCEGLSLSDCIGETGNDVGPALYGAVSGIFTALNQLGSDLGGWIYDMTH